MSREDSREKARIHFSGLTGVEEFSELVVEGSIWSFPTAHTT